MLSVLFLVAAVSSPPTDLYWQTCADQLFGACTIEARTVQTTQGTEVVLLVHSPIAYLSWGSNVVPLSDPNAPYAVESTQGAVGGGPWEGLTDAWEFWQGGFGRYELWPSIQGCGPTPPPFKRQLCDAQGLSGRFVYTWDLHRTVDLSQLWVEADGCVLTASSNSCGAPATFAVTTATPEPETWALMGVGLVAIGGLAWRQKRMPPEHDL